MMGKQNLLIPVLLLVIFSAFAILVMPILPSWLTEFETNIIELLTFGIFAVVFFYSILKGI